MKTKKPNGQRITIRFEKGGPRDERLEAAFGSVTYSTERWCFHPDDPLVANGDFMEKCRLPIIHTKRICNIYRNTPSNQWLKNNYRKRSEAIKTLLKDPYISPEIKDEIKKIRIIKFKKDNEFTTDLASEWKEVYSYLIDSHKLKKKDALALIIDLIRQMFPEEKQLKHIDEPSFEDAFRKAINRI